jgi:manganese/zinc/iron transport system permease protein
MSMDHLWIIVIAALTGAACAPLGCYLLLQRMSLMGDAISHAVLPGLALAFLLTGSRGNLTMLAGGGAIGVATALVSQWLHRYGRTDQNAAIGVVFTTLFALGLVLIVVAADHVDLDPNCVLYGNLELAGLDTVMLGSLAVPRAAIILTAVFVLDVVTIVCCYKALLLATFDLAHAQTIGFAPNTVQCLLMALVAINAVAAFEAVGTVLVVAMLIVPAATARLLTERLVPMLLISAVLAALAGVVGHIAAVTLPTLLGVMDTRSAGMIAVVSGMLFLAAAGFAPEQGLWARWRARWRLACQILDEDLLGLLYRLEERRGHGAALEHPALAELLGVDERALQRACQRLLAHDELETASTGVALSVAGRQRAARLVRGHRLWEVFLDRYLGVRGTQLHTGADRFEHHASLLTDALADALDHPQADPHGRMIPE